jgi:glyoxylase-like metal-dependent hydrolase (beta-lactamase superfamily II)
MQSKRSVRAAIVAFAGSLLAVAVALAAAPFAKTQPPGWYRMKLGDFEITVLADGTSMMPAGAFLTNIGAADLQQALSRAFLKDPVPTSDNGFLVNTGSKLVLIDTGNGERGDPNVGKLVANLKASGYQPEQVDEVYITHMHGDHIGGLTENSRPVFPHATVRADKREAEYWLSAANMNKADKDARGRFEAARTALDPYIAAGRFKTFDGATDLVPGVRSLPAYGHTPGHSFYVIESQGEKLVLCGDLLHVGAVQFANPAVGLRFDSDPTEAIAQRQKLLADAASQKYWIGAAHLAFPALGHVAKAGDGYAWVPVNYPQPP